MPISSVAKDDAGNYVTTYDDGSKPVTFAPGQISDATKAKFDSMVGAPPKPIGAGLMDVGAGDLPAYRAQTGLPTPPPAAAGAPVMPGATADLSGPVAAPGAGAPPPLLTAKPALPAVAPSGDLPAMPGHPLALAPPSLMTSQSSTTRTSGVSASPIALAMQGTAQREEKSALNNSAELQKAQALEEVPIQQRLDKQMTALETQQQAQKAANDAASAKAEQARDAAVASYGSMKLDPDHYWHSKSVGQRIMTALAVGLSAFGSGVTKRPDQVWEGIQNNINRDIEAQKEQIQNAKEGINLKNNLVAELRQKGMSLDQAFLTAKQIKVEQAKRQLDTLAAQYKLPAIDAQNQALQAAADKANAGLAVQQSIEAQGRSQTTSTTEIKPNPAAVPNAKTAITLPGGQTAFAPDEESARKLRESTAAVQNVRTIVNKIKQVASNNVGISLPTEARRELEGLQGELKLAFLKTSGVARITEPELEIASKQWADPTNFLTPNGRAMKTLDAFVGRTVGGYMNELKANGINMGGN